jgi:ABC-type multidrug transport system fused ATPase/permease subunit
VVCLNEWSSKRNKQVAQDGHLVWALPLAIIVVSTLLVIVLGWASLIGIAVLVLFLPVIQCVTTSMISIRSTRVHYTDMRVKLCTSMLQGMKVTKLNNYEDSYDMRVNEARKKELAALRKELAIWAMTLVVTVISPVVATAATFFLYILSDDAHVLTASRSFTVLLLFSTLRFPISYAGRLLGSTLSICHYTHDSANFSPHARSDSSILSNAAYFGFS